MDLTSTLGSAHLLALTVLVAACGPDRGPQSWIGERSATVRCTTSGPTRMPPVLLDVPAPRAPSGFFARNLDPLALDELGYQRDRVVCAVLAAPTSEAAEQTQAALAEFAQTRKAASASAIAASGRCTCEVARGLGIRTLVAGCQDSPSKTKCDPEQNAAGVQGAMKPVVDALSTVPLPLIHWRLVGPSDRDGWFADKYQELLDRHPGGSTVYLRGEAIPNVANGPLISRLFGVDDVTAIVRQDSGRALVVVRETDGDLVLDHFSYPAPISVSLLSNLDNANPDEYIARLAKPESTRVTSVEPGKGNMVEVDRVLLEDVDQMVVAASALLEQPYDLAQESRTEPEPFVDRVTFQAPFGQDGEDLVVRAVLTESGVAWAQGQLDAPLSPTLEELNVSAASPTFTAPGSERLAFVLRGTMTNRASFHGLRALPNLMSQIERSHPSTVGGEAASWRFDMPRVSLVGEFGTAATFTGLRDMFAKKDYRITMSFERDREIIVLHAQPR